MFFSNKNYNLLLEILYDYFVKEHDFTIGKDEEELTLKVMEMIFTKNQNKPQGMKNSLFVKELNKKSLNRIIKIITQKLQESSKKMNIPISDNIKKGDLQIASRPTHYTNTTADRISGYDNTRNTANNDVSKKFNQINNMREDENKKEPISQPKFQENMDDDNGAIMSLYEQEMQKRKKEEEEMAKKEENEKINNKMFEETKELITGFQTNEVPTSEGGLFPGFNNNLTNQGIPQVGSDVITSADPIREMSKKIIGKVDIVRTEDELNQAYQAPMSASSNDVLIPQPQMYNEIFKHYHKNYEKIYYFSVDSRDRNQENYPTPSTYQVEFDTVYKDILDIELISAEIPKSAYLINNSNNLIYFQETTTQESNGTYFTASIPVGNYTASTLATAIQTAMNVEGSQTYTVTVDETLTNKFTITSDTTNVDPNLFNLLFDGGSEKFGTATRKVYKENSIGPIIGYNRTDLTGETSYIAQNQYNLEGESYIYLHIKQLENLESPNGGTSAHDSFTKITLDTTTNTSIKFYKSENDYISKVYFVPPLAKLGQMIITFKTYNGDLYDFNGREHSLFFKIRTFNQSSNYFGQSANFPGN